MTKKHKSRTKQTLLFKKHTLSSGMDADMGKKLELLILTRQEDYQELSNKINQVNKHLNARMDALIERFTELNQKLFVITNKVNVK